MFHAVGFMLPNVLHVLPIGPANEFPQNPAGFQAHQWNAACLPHGTDDSNDQRVRYVGTFDKNEFTTCYPG